MPLSVQCCIFCLHEWGKLFVSHRGHKIANSGLNPSKVVRVTGSMQCGEPDSWLALMDKQMSKHINAQGLHGAV